MLDSTQNSPGFSNPNEPLYGNDLANSSNNSNNERKNLLSQQTLKAHQPLFKHSNWIYKFIISGLFFLTVGCVLLTHHWNLSLKTIDYTNYSCAQNACLIPFNLSQPFPKPVFIYYQIRGLYQNHRRFLSSRSDRQLLGQIMTPDSISTCRPLHVNEKNEMYLPCGAIANSMFTDEFELFYRSTDSIRVETTTKGIAWPSDIARKYGVLSDEALAGTVRPRNWTRSEKERGGKEAFKSDESLMNWMRPSLKSDFRKLDKIILHSPGSPFENGLPAGDYTLKITGDYPVKIFDGQKFFVLANTGLFGSVNSFYPILSIVLGVKHLLLAIAMIALPYFKRKFPPDTWRWRARKIPTPMVRYGSERTTLIPPFEDIHSQCQYIDEIDETNDNH